MAHAVKVNGKTKQQRSSRLTSYVCQRSHNHFRKPTTNIKPSK